MSIIAVIPARMVSSRFPGKPLHPILGLPMIEHVRRRTLLCSQISEVIVATCDQEIAEEVQCFGGKVAMTSDRHERSTGRVAEAAESLDAEIVINVQGDMPFVRPEMLADLVAPLIKEPNVLCADLMSPIQDESEFLSPNVVKVVVDNQSNALYYSREPIPSVRKAPPQASMPRYKQLGIVAFRRTFLQTFAKLPPTSLEVIESVDMLRVLGHGHRIRMVSTPFATIGVDTPEDLEHAIELMREDSLYPTYRSFDGK